MFAAVGKVDNKSYRQPDDQARPIYPAELVHHVAIEHDTQDGHHWNPRRTEGSWLARIGAPQCHHRDADNNESEQGSDIDHLSNIVDGSNTPNDRSKQAHQDGVLPRRAEFWMDIGEEFFGEQAFFP